MLKITELGCPGHFICAASCRWRRHTQVGSVYRVSSVGDYIGRGYKRETIGCGSADFFETMVFATTGRPELGSDGCSCVEVKDWAELECVRYATAGEAQAGHERLIKKYRTKVRKGGR